MVRLLLFVVLPGLIQLGSAQTDGGLEPDGSGSALVESVTERIQASCIFADDKYLLRRTAYVESADGTDPDTYRDGYHGGIWKVDQSFFDVTKSTEARYELLQFKEGIHDNFGIDWNVVRWEDCRRPLVSALAARLYIQYTSRHDYNGIPRAIETQADFWKSYYRTTGDTQQYIDKSHLLDTGCSSSKGADIVFVLDGSGSIGPENFGQVKEFVKSIVGGFEVGPYRFGLIQYSSIARTEFNLGDHLTQHDLIEAIDNVAFMGGGTSTDLAIQMLIDQAFLNGNGARPPATGLPKVGIILTDGRSRNQSSTIREAERAHSAGIIMIAVGVGSSVDLTELESIASDPMCLHLFLLTGFNEIDDLKSAIEERACEAPTVLNPENNGTNPEGRIPPGENINCQIKIPTGGATITLSTLSGSQSTIFLAKGTYPSAAFYEQKLISTPNNPAVAYIPNPQATASSGDWIIFCNVIGSKGTETNITFVIRPGDTTHCHSNPCLHGDCVEIVDGFRCDCSQSYTGRLCDSVIPPPTTTRPPTPRYDCDANSPCTPENIQNGNFYFSHHDPEKFVQCDAHGGCYVMPCAPGTVWDPDIITCNYAPSN